MINRITAEIRIGLHKELLRVRMAEQILAEKYKEQEMRTPAHFGLGQEAVAVGVCGALNKDDVAYSHHRSHNHYLAKGGNVHQLAAELYGRETGCSRGRGGSVHLTDREHGFIASSAILGETVAAAVGSALSIRMDDKDLVACAFFGDAVLEEGVFYESINYAAIQKLPVLLVCENNGFATESPMTVRQPENIDFCTRVAAFGFDTKRVDGNDVEAVYLAAQEAVASVRETSVPYFLECTTYRWCEHVGPYFDYELDRTYRTLEELEEWMAKCPVKKSAAALVAMGIASQTELDGWEDDTRKAVEDDIARAYADPWPDPKNLFDNIY